MKPKQIPGPDLPSAQVLSPMELNNLKFTDRHTLLTPEVLESHAPAERGTDS
jgi:hypothetical protein